MSRNDQVEMPTAENAKSAEETRTFEKAKKNTDEHRKNMMNTDQDWMMRSQSTG
jgi:hypothetical protein